MVEKIAENDCCLSENLARVQDWKKNEQSNAKSDNDCRKKILTKCLFVFCIDHEKAFGIARGSLGHYEIVYSACNVEFVRNTYEVVVRPTRSLTDPCEEEHGSQTRGHTVTSPLWHLIRTSFEKWNRSVCGLCHC